MILQRSLSQEKPQDWAGGQGKISRTPCRVTHPAQKDRISTEKPQDGTAGQGIFTGRYSDTQNHPQKSHDCSDGQGIFGSVQGRSGRGQGKNRQRAVVVRVNQRQKPTSNRGGSPVGDGWIARGRCERGFCDSRMGEESNGEFSAYE